MGATQYEQRGKELKWTPGHVAREMAVEALGFRGIVAMLKNMDDEYIESQRDQIARRVEEMQGELERLVQLLRDLHSEQATTREVNRKKIEG